MLPIICLTNDKHLWLLPGFMHLFSKYWPKRQVTVVGYSRPSFEMPDGFGFHSISPANYPANRWSDGLIEYLHTMGETHFILMLEDYWLTEPVKTRTIETLEGIIVSPQLYRVLRIDLTADRQLNPTARYRATWGETTIIQTAADSDYQMSYQAAIWNKANLLKVLKEGENPWASEMNGTARLAKMTKLEVLGTTVHPVKYRPVYRTHRDRLDLSSLSEEDKAFITSKGWDRRG